MYFFQAEDGIRDRLVTGVQACALPIFFAKRLHQLLGEVGANASDHAAAQVLLDAVNGTWRHHLEKGRLKLHAVITVVIPSTAALDELTGLDGCGGP